MSIFIISYECAHKNRRIIALTTLKFQDVRRKGAVTRHCLLGSKQRNGIERNEKWEQFCFRLIYWRIPNRTPNRGERIVFWRPNMNTNNIRPKFLPNTNTNNIRQKISSEHEYEYYSSKNFHRIRIWNSYNFHIILSENTTEYEYE